MYIRTRDEALDALSQILELPERTAQIVQVTVLIASCLDDNPRRFLVDCQRSFIEDGLTAMRRRRKDALANLRKAEEAKVSGDETSELFVIVDTERDELLEQVGTAMDTLRMVEVVQEVFPEMAKQRPGWQIGRAILTDEEVIRDSLTAAVRHRGDSEKLGPIQTMIDEKVEDALPEWLEHADVVKQACEAELEKPAADFPPSSAASDPEFIHDVIALYDASALTLIDLASSNGAHAGDLINEIRKRVQILVDAERHSGD